MKQSALIILIIMSFGIARAQSDTVFIKHNISEYDKPILYKTDTVLYDTPNAIMLLYKTRVLPSTYNQQVAKGYGLFLDNVNSTPCQSSDGYRPDYINKVNSVVSNGDSLTIDVKFWGNCCHSFLCDVEIIDGNTINLITIGYGAMYCSCDCCFGISFNFESHKIFKEDFDKLKFISINGDKKRKFTVTN